MTRFGRNAAVLIAALALSGCALLDDLPRFGEARVVAELEVFNRTEDPIHLIAADAERLDVPACGTALDPDFRVDNVEVRTEAGYFYTFGYGGPEAGGEHLYLVLTAESQGALPTLGPSPDTLPPCEGMPQVQAGVPLQDPG